MYGILVDTRLNMSSAVLALARILPVAKFQAEPWLDSIVDVLHSGLAHIKRSPAHTEALLALVGGCASAFGPAIEKAITICLDSMFSEGLSAALVKAADAIALNIPGLAFIVRMKLLDSISMIIAGTSFQDFAAPAASSRRASMVNARDSRPGHERRRSTSLLIRTRARSVSPMRDLVTNHKPEDACDTDTAAQIQALHYLGSVFFGQQPLLLGYFQQQVTPLLSCSDINLRRAAMQACCGFLAQELSAKESEQLTSAVRDIVHAIMLVGVADDNALLRVEALQALGQKHFDKYLVRSAPLM